MSSQWDTTFAVRYHQANSTIVRDWGTVNSGCKAIVNQPDSDGVTTMDATLAPWRIEADGDGMNVRMSISVVVGKQTLPEALGKPPVDLSGVKFQIEVVLAYVADPDNKKKLNLRTQAADAPGSGVAKSVFVMGMSWPDGVEDPGIATDGYIKSSFTLWIQSHIQDFDYIFHTLDMSDKIDSDPEWQFIKPTSVQYGCTDTGGVFSTGTFGANTMITGTDNGPHTPPDNHQVSVETIPDGCSAGFDISGPVFMREMLLNGAALQFQLPDGVLPPQEDNGATFNPWVNDSFDIGPDGLMCSNRVQLVFGNYIDNEGKNRKLLVDKQKFRMLLADGMVQVFFDDLYYDYGFGITVHMVYTEKSTVGLVDAVDKDGQPKKVFTLIKQDQSSQTTIVKGMQQLLAATLTSIAGATLGALTGGLVGGVEGVTTDELVATAKYSDEEVSMSPVSVQGDVAVIDAETQAEEGLRYRGKGIPLDSEACEELETPNVRTNPSPMNGMFNKISPRIIGAISGGIVGGGIGYGVYSFAAAAGRKDFDNYASLDVFTLNAIQAHNWPGADGFRLMTATLTDTSSLRLGLDAVAPGYTQTRQWDAFFSRTAFPLTFADDSNGTLSPSDATKASLGFAADGAETFLTPGGSASDPGFQLDARFPEDSAAGYLIRRNDNGTVRYVAYERGTHDGRSCLMTTVEARRAAVFVPVYVRDRQSFMLQELSTGEVLTLPWTRSDKTLAMSDVIDLAPRGTTQYDAAQQIFRMPLWVTRVFESAFFSTGTLTDINILVSDGTRILKASGDKLQVVPLGTGSGATALHNSPDTLVKISRIDTSIYGGYTVSVGGKYLKMQPPSGEIVLVDKASEGSPFSPIVSRLDGSQMTLWNYTSNFFVDVQNDTVIATEATTPQQEPSVTFVYLRDPPAESADLLKKTPTGYLTGEIIGPVVSMLRTKFPVSRGTVWNGSNNNTLGEVDEWLLSTPENGTGDPDYIAQHILDPTDDFGLQKYTTPVDNQHPGFVLQSTVKRPGDSPVKYHAGHSRALYESAYGLMTSATAILDITSLLGSHEPQGPMLSAMRNAITFLSHTAAAKEVVIRILLGNVMGSTYASGGQSAPELLKELVRDVESNTSKMKVYVGYTGQFSAWNHSKIIAADGERAMVGGHNLYSEYLNDLNLSPPFDVSMKLSGLAAADGHRFADNLWHQQMLSGNQHSTISDKTMAMFDAETMETITGRLALPDPAVFEDALPDFDDSFSERIKGASRGTAVVGVGRVEETLANKAPADQAILSLVGAAKSSIHISQQALGFSYSTVFGDNFNDDLMQSLAQALRNGVRVIIYVSAPGATVSGYGGGDPKKLKSTMSSIIGSDKTVLDNFDVRAFPLATKWNLNPAKTSGLNNHAKTILVDMKAFLIGSHNLYPTGLSSSLSEFSYLVENADAAQAYYDAYFKNFKDWAVPYNDDYVNPPTFSITVTEIECFSPSSWFGDGDHIVIEGKYIGAMKVGDVKPFNLTLDPVMYDSRSNLLLEADNNQFRTKIVNFVWTFEEFQFLTDDQLSGVRSKAGKSITALAKYTIRYTVTKVP